MEETTGKGGGWDGDREWRLRRLAEDADVESRMEPENIRMKLRRARPEHGGCMFSSDAPCKGQKKK